MKCPVCKSVTLVSHELQPRVKAQKCSGCGGLWLDSLQFSNWIAAATADPASVAASTPSPLAVHEPKAAKICPECSHLMSRYKVGHALRFTLDRCGSCGGSWFDGNEWETLKASALWNQVHLIFSPSWQVRVRHAEHVQQRLAQLADRLGPVDFVETQRIRQWLESHSQRETILAYLISEKD